MLVLAGCRFGLLALSLPHAMTRWTEASSAIRATGSGLVRSMRPCPPLIPMNASHSMMITWTTTNL
jgi:hypothetical protein